VVVFAVRCFVTISVFLLVVAAVVFTVSRSVVLMRKDAIMSGGCDDVSGVLGAARVLPSDTHVSEIFEIFARERDFWRNIRTISGDFKSRLDVSGLDGGRSKVFHVETDSSITVLWTLTVSDDSQVIGYPFVYELKNGDRLFRIEGNIRCPDNANDSFTELAPAIITDLVEPLELFHDFRNVTRESFLSALTPSEYDSESETFVLTTKRGSRLFFVNGNYHKKESNYVDVGLNFVIQREEWKHVDKGAFPHRIKSVAVRSTGSVTHELVLEGIDVLIKSDP